MGDLAGALYAYVGGDAAMPEDAVDFLASYGIIAPESTVEDSLTAAGAEETLAFFSEAIGVPYTPAEGADETVLNRGELAELLMSYLDYLDTLEEG